MVIDMEKHWASILIALVPHLPYIVVFLIGIVLSSVFWHRHPSVSLMALLAFLILLGSQVFSIGSSVWVMNSQDSVSSMEKAQFLGVVGLIRSALGVIAFGFLMTAIFGWRRIDSNKL